LGDGVVESVARPRAGDDQPRHRPSLRAPRREAGAAGPSAAIALTALIALVAYDIPIFRSVNLFDYVVDPIVGIVAIGWAVVVILRRYV